MGSSDIMIWGAVGMGAYLIYRMVGGSSAAVPASAAIGGAVAAPVLVADHSAASGGLSVGGGVTSTAVVPSISYADALAEYNRVMGVTPAAPVGGSEQAATAGNVAAPTGPTLDAYYQKLLSNVAANHGDTRIVHGIGSEDGTQAPLSYWALALNANSLGLPVGVVGDDPVSAVFGNRDQNRVYTAAQVWAEYAPYLRSKGLAGLGMFGGLGALAMSARAVQ